MQMAQVPFIALGLVLLAYLSHVLWDAAGFSGRNYGPLIVLCASMVLAAVIVVGGVGYLLDRLLAAIETRLLGWRKEAF